MYLPRCRMISHSMASSAGRAEFPLTRWSLVLRLREGTEEGGGKALEELCALYWLPIYSYALRSGQAPHDAEDLTQGFFARLLERDLFAKADRARGRLRSFLLGAFKHFMSEEWRQAARQKRGGGRIAIPLHDLHDQELRDDVHGSVPVCEPQSAFDRVWFDVLLEHALNDLEAEYQARGRGTVFARLQEFLAWNHKDARLAEAARELGMSPGAVRVTIVRMRQRFRELIECRIAETVATPAEAAEELEHLRQVLGA